MKTTIPYDWKLDLERNRTGANVHDSISMEGCLNAWLYLIQKHEEEKDKIKYFKTKLNKALKKGFEKGLFSYKHEL